MDSIFGMLCPVSFFIALAVAIAVIADRREKKRREEWRLTAARLNLRVVEPGGNLQAKFHDFKTFSAGRSHETAILLQGEANGLAIHLADHRYVTGSGKNRTTHRLTLCILEDARLHLPHCFFRPQARVLDTLGKWLGGQDLDFPDDPDFSSAYVLQGENEAAIRALFKPEIRGHFAGRRGENLHFEAEGSRFLFHTGKRRSPAEAESLLREAFAILERLHP